MPDDTIDSTLQALAQQPFRARFHLRGRDAATVELRGMKVVRRHAAELLEVICRWIETDLAASGRRAPR